MQIRRWTLIVPAALIALSVFGCAKKESAPPSTEILGGVVNLIASPEHYQQALSVAGTRVVMVDLYADWCKPCHMLAPILTEIAGEQRDRVIILKVNVDRLPTIARSFNVQGIPLVVFIKNGQTVGSLVGLYPKESYLESINRYSAQ